MSLRAREIVYHGQLAGKRLIGELHLTESDLTALAADYHALPYRERENFPLARAVALAFCGVYGYKSGNFWDHAAKRFPELADLNRHKRWTDAFVKTIDKRRLEPFADFPPGALRYVSRILAHGGVPNGCLPDFFALVHLAITRPEWASLTPADLIAEWQAREFRFLPTCDLPVQRFLMYGGDVARDFLQRAIDMASTRLQTGTVPDAADVGLPGRVVDQFAALEAHKPRTTRQVARLVSPAIRYDPWQPDGMTIDLPAQPIGGGTGVWTITAENAAAPVSTRVHPEQNGRARQYLLDTPAARYAVAYDTGMGEPARWIFPGMADARPFLAFDGASGKLLRAIDALPARSLALVMPIAYTDVLDQSGASLIREEFPPLVGGWRGYRGVTIDSTATSTLRITGSGAPTIGPLPVHSDSAERLRPTVDSAARALPGVTAGIDALPILPTMPILRIPRTAPAEDDLWSVHVASAKRAPGDDMPGTDGIDISYAVRDLATTDGDGEIIVPLGQPALLPPGAAGPLTVTARGPLGRDVRFSFVLIPGFAVVGTGRPIVRPANGTASATLSLSADIPLLITSHTAHASIIHDQAEASAAALELRAHFGKRAPYGAQHFLRATNHTITLDLATPGAREPIVATLALPWPRWAVQGIGDRAALQWTDMPVAIARDELAGATAASLRLDGLTVTPRASREVAGHVALTIAGQTVSAEVRGMGAWLPLAPFADTIRASNAATLRGTLDLWGPAGHRLVIDQPIITITRALSVSGLTFSDVVETGGAGAQGRLVTATWHETYALENRHLRFWSLAEPWAAPVSYGPIPVEAGGRYTFAVPVAELPAGPYRAEMIVRDPWAMDETATPPSAPSRGADGPVRDVILGDVDEQAARLDRLPGDAFGALTRFLLTNKAIHLQRLPDLLALDAVEPALRVLLLLLARERSGAADDPTLRIARDALREAIIIHPDCGSALVDVIARGTDSATFAHLLAALGLAQAGPRAIASLLARLDDVDRSAIETAWPLALTGDARTLACLAERYARAETILGTAGLKALFEPPLEDQPLQPRQIQARGIVAHFDATHFDHTGQGSFFRNHTRPVADLAYFAAHFTTPVRALDGDYLIAAMLEWLIGAKQNLTAARMRAWVEQEYDRCDAALAALEGTSLTPRQHIAAQLAAARRVPREWLEGGSGTNWILMFPLIAGVTALMQRLIARRNAARDAVSLPDDYWRENGRIATLVGPALSHYDLCTFDLLLLPEGDHVSSET